jgi:hypothetical protein
VFDHVIAALVHAAATNASPHRAARTARSAVASLSGPRPASARNCCAWDWPPTTR